MKMTPKLHVTEWSFDGKQSTAFHSLRLTLHHVPSKWVFMVSQMPLAWPSIWGTETGSRLLLPSSAESQHYLWRRKGDIPAASGEELLPCPLPGVCMAMAGRGIFLLRTQESLKDFSVQVLTINMEVTNHPINIKFACLDLFSMAAHLKQNLNQSSFNQEYKN